MKYSHIFWDWNGTLLNDSWLSTKVISDMLSKRGLGKISVDDYRNRFGFPVIDFYKEMKFDFETEAFEEVGKEFISNYNAQRHQCELHLGAYELIESLCAKGVRQSVVSAYQRDFLKEVVKDKNLDKFMHSIVGLDNIFATSKVDIAKNHFDSLGISPSEVLFVGDTEHDSHAAEEIACDCVFISHGHCSHARLENYNTHKVFSNHSELKTFLGL